MNSSMLKYSFRNSSENNHRKLSSCSRNELYQLRQKNMQILNNKTILQNLSDKGDKLRETNELIDALLADERTATAYDTITTENTTLGNCPLTKTLEAMSLLTPRQGARKRSVDLANQQALYNQHLPKRLLSRRLSTHQPLDLDYVKARMITMDESLKLQISKREDTLDLNNPSKKLLNALNISSLRHTLQNDPQEYEFLVEDPVCDLFQETICEDMNTDE